MIRLLCLVLLLGEFPGLEASKIHSGLFKEGKENEDVIVTFGAIEDMKEMAHHVQSEYAHSSKEQRIYALYEAFHGYHSECTGEAKTYLDENSYEYKGMWSMNTMVIRKADRICAEKLSEMNDVKKIGPNRVYPLIDPVEKQMDNMDQFLHGLEKEMKKEEKEKEKELMEEEGDEESDKTKPKPMKLGLSWGLSSIYVPEAWEYVPEGSYYGAKSEIMNGQGIVVANIDSGVNADHEALKDNHRTFAGWADGYNKSSKPVDKNGHGTHTMGTICGSHGIGVAPGAQWIACRGCLEEGCDTAALMFCCNWVICPHDPTKHEPDDYKHCSTAPDLVSNSWGGDHGDDTFERCALALRTAGIIPIWAHGNSGPECNTSNSPGDLSTVIGVGALDKDNKLADFSSRGPTVDGRMKPDISAPGVQIHSAWHNGSKSYVSISGTSMATPHVAGLIALMIQRCRLNFDTILNILQKTADRTSLGHSKQVCGDTPTNTFPNNFYGYGKVNALDAVKTVAQLCHISSYGPVSYDSSYHSSTPSNPIYGGPSHPVIPGSISYPSLLYKKHHPTGKKYTTPSGPSGPSAAYGRSRLDKFDASKQYDSVSYQNPIMNYNGYGYLIYRK